MTCNGCYPTAISALDRGYSHQAPATFSVSFQLVDFEEQFYNANRALTLLGGTVGQIAGALGVSGALAGEIGSAITGLSSTTPSVKI